MRYTITDDFDCSPQELRKLFESDEFERRLENEIDSTRDVVDETTEDGLEITTYRFASRREIPAVMQKALGVERIEYDRTERSDRETGTTTWTVKTPFMTERVDVEGTTTLEETDGGCRRIVEGKVSIDLPVVGGKMEEKFANRVRGADEAMAKIARQILDEE